MKKILIKAAIGFLFVIVVLFGVHQIVKTAIVMRVTKTMGVPVHIDRLAVNILKPTLHIRGLKLYNPTGYPKEVFLDAPRISIGYDFKSIVTRKLHLPSVVVSIKEFVVVKNKEKQLNVDYLKLVQKNNNNKKVQKVIKPMPIKVDVLTLSIGKVIKKDYSLADEVQVKEIYVGIVDKKYKNITGTKKLALFILAESMKATGIKASAVYGAALLAGPWALPAGAAVLLMDKGSAQLELDIAYDKAYKVSVGTIQELGEVSSENKAKGVIISKVNDYSVIVKVIQKAEKKTQIVVLASKNLVPKPKVAGGVLYHISEKLR